MAFVTFEIDDDDRLLRLKAKRLARERGTTVSQLLREYFMSLVAEFDAAHQETDVAYLGTTRDGTHLTLNTPIAEQKSHKGKTMVKVQPEQESEGDKFDPKEDEFVLACDKCVRLLPVGTKERFDRRVNKPCHTNGCKGVMRGKAKMNR